MADDHASKPARPAITPVFTMACLFWPASAICLSLGRNLNVLQCAFGCAALGALSTVLLAWCLVSRKHVILLYACAAIIGCSLGLGASAKCLSSSIDLDGITLHNSGATVVGDSKRSDFGETAFLKLDDFDAVVYASFEESRPLFNGEHIQVTGSCRKPDWEGGEYLWQHGASARIAVGSFRKDEPCLPYRYLVPIRSNAINCLKGDDESSCLLQAITCGYRRTLEGTRVYTAFQTCGLAHLVAVSGAHLVIATGLLVFALHALRVPRRVGIFATIAAMSMYFVFAGAPVSALRATVMSSIGVLSLFGKRRPSALNSLGIGIFAIIATSPTSSISASFTLSCLSSTGIILFAPLIGHWIEKTALGRLSVLADALSLTLAANLLSLPYACSLFNQLPVISPLSNVACAPLFPFVCITGLAAAMTTCLAPSLCPFVLGIAKFSAGAFSEIAACLAELPYACIPVDVGTLHAIAVSIAIAMALWVFWPSMKTGRIIAAYVIVILAVALSVYVSSQEDSIVMLDVGQGDSFLVRSKGQTLLIDTGNQDKRLLEQLASCHIARIDTVLVTHADDDHVGSLDAINRSMHVERILVAEGLEGSTSDKNRELLRQAEDTASQVVPVTMGDSFDIGNFKASVVWPRKLSDDGGNKDSICLLLEYDGNQDGCIEHTALFTGDAESDELKSIVESGFVGDVDILKVGHHGSESSLTDDLAERLHPEVALIGVGANNRYGHPSHETLEILESIGCSTFRSDRDGQVKCIFSCEEIRIALQ